MQIVLICLKIFSFLVAAVASAEEGCVFKLNKNIPKTALILKNQNTPEFLYPDQLDTIHIPKDAEIRISCADKYLDNVFYVKDLNAKCIKDDSIQVKFHVLCKKEVKLHQLECKTKPELVARFAEKRCYSNGRIMEIGYSTGKSFLKIFSTCWDDFEEKTIYSWYANSKLHLGKEQKIRNIAYDGSHSFSFPVADVYDYAYQKQLFTRILRSEALADQYIVNNHLFTIVASQLISKNEFVYGPEQTAAFHYLNTAPQWRIFKDGNWAAMEKSLIDFISKPDLKENYGVATGTYGTATLPNLFQEEEPLFMFTDKYENNYLPVPKYFWKILYNYATKTGTVFIGIHNPFVGKKVNNYIFCEDICDQVTWLKINNAHPDRGYMFCCDMKEFLKVTQYENMFESFNY